MLRPEIVEMKRGTSENHKRVAKILKTVRLKGRKKCVGEVVIEVPKNYLYDGTLLSTLNMM